MKKYETDRVIEVEDIYETVRLDVSNGKGFSDAPGTRVIMLVGMQGDYQRLFAVPIGDDYNLTRYLDYGYDVVGMGMVVEKVGTVETVTWRQSAINESAVLLAARSKGAE